MWRYYNARKAAVGEVQASIDTATFVGRLTSIAGEAYAFAISMNLPGLHNGEQDAVRHAVWQCLMTKAFGATTARDWGNAHEHGQPVNAEVRMDFHNNEIGRQIGASSASCETGVPSAYHRKLLRLSPADFTTQGSFVPNPPATIPPPPDL